MHISVACLVISTICMIIYASLIIFIIARLVRDGGLIASLASLASLIPTYAEALFGANLNELLFVLLPLVLNTGLTIFFLRMRKQSV